ncbi:MAG: hypothetical protein IKS21_00755 [Oscillospiraceae bacterium]|nr:hypothetical protein [Oscillospiraceae bacterium]
MRSISYRARARWRKGLTVGLFAMALLLLAGVLFVIYLGRFVVYTPSGARLDFGRDSSRDVVIEATESAPTVPLETVEIEFAAPDPRGKPSELISGWYIDLEMLQNPSAVLEAVQALSAPCTVLIDLKGSNGSFYYTTGIDTAQRAEIDVATVDAILSYLRSHGFTMVARIRTFQDTHFAEQHVNCSLQTANGALWVGNGFYWLDPGNDTVLAYLKQIARELAEKGFKEIVFDDFRFPNGTQIVYRSEKSRAELIADVATDLLNFFSSSNITISFGNPMAELALSGASHVYLSGITGSGVNAAVKSFHNLEKPESQIVFLTASKDNRFDDYQVLRPLVTQTLP